MFSLYFFFKLFNEYKTNILCLIRYYSKNGFRTTRLEIINNCFEGIGVDLTAEEWEIIGEKTEGYSFSDLMNVAMRACCERFLTMKNCKYWDHEGRHESSMRTGML